MSPFNLAKGATEKGLTLIEVLVSIVVLATAAASLLSLLSQQTANLSALEERAFARIAAENALVAAVTGDFVGQRKDGSSAVELGGIPFLISVDRQASPYLGVNVLMVTVTNDNGETVLAQLTTLRPQ